jgi:hypothetical protein
VFVLDGSEKVVEPEKNIDQPSEQEQAEGEN